MQGISRGQQIRDSLFTRLSPGSDEWVCVCGTKRKNSRTGYTNLVTHVQSQHPNDSLKLESNEFLSNFDSHESPKSSFYPKKTIQVNGWLKLVIEELLPFRIVESHVYRNAVKFPPTSRPTLMKYMSLLTKIGESRVSQELLDIFAIVLDRWTANSSRYLCMFATYTDSTQNLGYSSALLGMSTFEIEDSQRTNAHHGYLTFVLETFNRSVSNVAAIIGDNCNFNHSLANKMNVGFMGCSSHRYNLAIKDIMADDDSSVCIEKV